MSRTHILGDYLSRHSVYVLLDGKDCLYVGKTSGGRAGVADRISAHLANAALPNPAGGLHVAINAGGRLRNRYLKWKLTVYSVSECATLTEKKVSSVGDAEKAMIELLKPRYNRRHNLR